MKIFLMLNTLLAKSEVKGGYFTFIFIFICSLVGCCWSKASIMPFMAVVEADVIEDKFLAAIFRLNEYNRLMGF